VTPLLWERDVVDGAVTFLDAAIRNLGTRDPDRIAEFIDGKMDDTISAWADGSYSAHNINRIWMARSMVEFHKMAIFGRRLAQEVCDERRSGDIELLEEMNHTITHYRREGQGHGDWSLVADELAADILRVCAKPWS